MSTRRSTGWPIRRSASCVSLKFASTQISRQAEGNAALVHIFQRLVDLRLGHRKRFLPLIEFFLARDLGRKQPLGPFEFGLREDQGGFALVQGRDLDPQRCDLVVHLLDGVPEFPALAPGLRGSEAVANANPSACKLYLTAWIIDCRI